MAAKSGIHYMPASSKGNEIETGHGKALEDNGQPAHTAIGVVVERGIDRFHVSPPHWYNTLGVMMFEHERIRPSGRTTLEKTDPEIARATWGMSGMLAAAIRADQLAFPGAAQNPAFRAHQWATGHPYDTDRSTGIHIYINAEKGNWAFYDKAGYGRAHVDGHDYNIDKHSWRKAPDGRHHQILQDGQWKTVQLDAVDVQQTQLAQLPASHSSEIHLLLHHSNPQIAASHDREQNEPTLASYSENDRSSIAAATCVECQKAGLNIAAMTDLECYEKNGKTQFMAMDPVKAERNPYTSFVLVNADQAVQIPVQDSLNQMQAVQIAQAQAMEQNQQQGRGIAM